MDFNAAWAITNLGLNDVSPAVLIGITGHEVGDGKCIIVLRNDKTLDELKILGTGSDILGYTILIYNYLEVNNLWGKTKVSYLGEDLISNFKKGRIQAAQIHRQNYEKVKDIGTVVSTCTDYYQFSSMGLMMYRDNYEKTPKEDIKKLIEVLNEKNKNRPGHQTTFRGQEWHGSFH